MGFKGPASSRGTTAGPSRRLLTTMSFLVRPWAKRDVREVMLLVRELALSHNALHEVTTSPEALQKEGFEKDAIFGFLVAEVPPARKSKEGPTLVGYHFHYLTYCTWDGPVLFGEDLYVKPEFRGRGVGTALLNRAAKIALDQGCSQFRFISAQKNPSATDFYPKRGATDVTLQDSWHVFRIDRGPLAKLIYRTALLHRNGPRAVHRLNWADLHLATLQA